jgi:NTE family protein
MRSHRLLLLPVLAVLSAGCASQSAKVNCATLPTKSAAVAVAPPSCPLPPLPSPYPFTNLVLQGGGVLGSAYAGSLAVLEQQGIYEKIDRVAGTSAGAIVATLVALRFPAKDIETIVNEIDFRNFEDGGSIFRLLKHFGYYKGDYALGLIRCLISKKFGVPPTRKVTFRDLHEGKYRDLHVFSTDISTKSSMEFSFVKTPDFEVALAVRMSLSIPLFFAAVRDDLQTYVDGGVLRNYPIDLFDGRQVNPATLGLSLQNVHAKPTVQPVNDIPQYLKALFSTILDVQDIALGNNLPDLERSVIIDNLGISFTDFGLNQAQKEALVASGAKCTCSYLEDWRKWDAAHQRPSAMVGADEDKVTLVGAGRCGLVLPPAAVLPP